MKSVYIYHGNKMEEEPISSHGEGKIFKMNGNFIKFICSKTKYV